MKVIILSVVFVYLGIMLLIGYYASKKVQSNDDFLVAGRRLGPLMMAGTLAATEIGGGASLGVVEKAYGSWGMSAAWYVIAMAISFVILAFFCGKLRKALVKTVPEYFRRRYGEAPGLITAIIMILPLIGLTAIQFTASAVVLSVMTGLSFTASVIIVSIVVTIYSVLGGLWAVTLTDFVQMFLIVIGMILAVPFALNAAGGWGEVVKAVPAERMSLTGGIGIGAIISLVIMYTASFAVGQEAVQRYYAAKDEKAAVQGSLIAGGVNMVFAFIPVILGLAAFSMVQNGIMDGTEILANGARYVLPTIAMQTMPPVLVGLLFAGLISATMSSADSDLLGAGSIFANDIYKIYINKNADDKKILRVARLSMIFVSLISLFIALANTASIITVLMFSFTLRAGGAFFPYIIGHYWKKASTAGAMASVVFGSLTVVLIEKDIISVLGLDAIIPGLVVSLITFVGFSYLIPPKNLNTDLTVEDVA